MKNKGISLIVLVITIIVMIILSVTMVLTITNSDILPKASESVVKTSFTTMPKSLDIYLSNKMLETNGEYNRSLLYADGEGVRYNGVAVEGETLKQIIGSDDQPVTIVAGELVYVGDNMQHKEWFDSIIKRGWNGVHEINALQFISEEPFTLKVYDNTKHWDGSIEYSTDNITWALWDGISTLSSVNNSLYLRGIGNNVITGYNPSSNSFRWILTGNNIQCIGNVENLLDYATVAMGQHPTMNIYCYDSMFSGCTSLTIAPELKATELKYACYRNMFSGCTSLTTAPALQATTLAENCYESMFSGCTGLTTAPVLPATTLENSCYQYMFSGCTSLTTAPVLPAIKLEVECYQNMFQNCTSLTKTPKLEATTLAAECYDSMFLGCTSLTEASALPATTLETSCYQYMFSGCTSLTTAPALLATTLADDCCKCMFSGCTSLTTAPALLATTLAKNCYNCMFWNCTGLIKVSELPATILKDRCYLSMFNGCTSLEVSSEETDTYKYAWRIPTSGTGATATDAMKNMLLYTVGTVQGTPNINITYYLKNPPVAVD